MTTPSSKEPAAAIAGDLGPLMLDLKGLSLTKEEQALLENKIVGGLILFSRNFQDTIQLKNLLAAVREIRPDLLVAVDHEGGRVQRFRQGFTHIPAMARLGEHYHSDADTALVMAQDWGWLMAAELRCFDIDMSFAPVLDIDYGNSQVIGDRAFSQQIDIINQLAAAFCDGMRQAGMAATGKHFPGHGFVAVDSHVGVPEDTRSLDEITQTDLKPFEQLIRLGMEAVMPAHVIYQQVDAQPAGFSAYWLQSVLRQQLGFDGVIFSDDLDMAGAGVAGDFPERAAAALSAGCDMVLVCNNPKGALEVLAFLEGQSQWHSNSRIVTMKGKEQAFSCLEELHSDARWQRVSQAINTFHS